MSYVGYITQLKNVRRHPNADRLLLGDCFGNTVCVDLTYTEGQVGVYFPVDGQLSEEFCEKNNLIAKKDENGNHTGGYLHERKRNIKAIRLRGEKSDGIFLPLSCLDYCFRDEAAKHLNIGDTVDVVNGHLICNKYIPARRQATQNSESNRTRKRKDPVAPLFLEHADTEQLAYNLKDFNNGDLVEITLKMHGTSQRTAYVPVLKKYKRSLLDRILRRPGTPVYDWDYITGTRRVVLDGYEGGFYGDNSFREKHAERFRHKLLKGETVYYEVVGFIDSGEPIMFDCDNKKLKDKEFITKYGDITRFSYGCAPNGYIVETWWDDEKTEPALCKSVPYSKAYVYRMTMTNEDGDVVEYSPELMRYRCEQIGVETVPVLWRGLIPFNEAEMGIRHDHDEYPINAGEWIKAKAEKYYDGPDPIGLTHIREGVVVRILNRPKFCAYKYKNFNFKMLESIIKDEATQPDMEEAQSQEVEE